MGCIFCYTNRVNREGPGKKGRGTKAELLREIARAESRIKELERAAELRDAADRSLQTLAKRSERMFESSRDGIVLLNGATGRVEQVNRSFSALTGLEADHAVGRPLWDLPSLSATDAGLVAFRELQTRDHIYYDDLPLLKSDGTRMSVEMTCSLHHHGDRSFIQCTFRETTERRRIEESLWRSEARFRALFQSAPIGIAFLDPAGQVVENNRALETMLGYGKDELHGGPFSSRALFEDQSAQVQLFEELREGTRSSFRLANRWVRKDGSLLWGLMSASSIRERGSGIQYIVIMVEDITERKRAEEAVIRSRDFYRLLLNELPNPIRLADADGRCDYFNRAWLSFTGRRLEHELGDGWARGIHPDDRGRVLASLHEAVLGRIPFTTEYRLRRASGDIRWVMEFGTPFTDVDGNVSGYLSSCYDVHDRKALEETLQSISITDELTGLLNRRGFFALAQQQMKIANRARRGLLLFYGDLDGLKSINDTLGHRVGDQALVEAAALLREVFRESDIIARLGGDEFAVLMMEESGAPDDVAIRDRLDRAVRARNAQVARTYQLSLSTGIHRYDPENPVSLDRLISIADGLMYEEKKTRKRTP